VCTETALRLRHARAMKDGEESSAAFPNVNCLAYMALVCVPVCSTPPPGSSSTLASARLAGKARTVEQVDFAQ
jgi:hypothetical protein